MDEAQPGMVYLVGAGPGDPGLLTLRGRQVLERCHAVVYDYLAEEALLDFAPPEAARVYAGKTGAHQGSAQRQARIISILVHRAREGQRVVRLKGGDPFIFGRGGEEAIALKEAGVRFEVVPGVTSAIAAPAYAGIPLTHRGVNTSVAFITGHEDPNTEVGRTDWEALARVARAGGTVVILMGVKTLARNMQFLQEHGVDAETPAALVRWGTRPSQQTVVGQLGNIAERVAAKGIRPPAITVVGQVVALRSEMQWFEQRPLMGRTVLITRQDAKAQALGRELRDLGAIPVELPTIAVEPLESSGLDEALKTLNRYNVLLLTSANTVHVVMQRVEALGYDARVFAPVQIGVVGRATANALREYGLRADHIPEVHTSDALAELIVERYAPGTLRALLPQAMQGRGVLPREIAAHGGHADVIPVYRTVSPDAPNPDMVERVRNGNINIATFASPSAVRNLAEIVGHEAVVHGLANSLVGCIGPVTAQAARDLGLHVDVVPKVSTMAALISAIIANVKGDA